MEGLLLLCLRVNRGADLTDHDQLEQWLRGGLAKFTVLAAEMFIHCRVYAKTYIGKLHYFNCIVLVSIFLPMCLHLLRHYASCC